MPTVVAHSRIKAYTNFCFNSGCRSEKKEKANSKHERYLHYWRSSTSNYFYFKEAKEKRGRPSRPNGCFPFASTHPLYETHELCLRSKIKVSVLSYAPIPPPTKPGKLKEAWKKQARIFARFFWSCFGRRKLWANFSRQSPNEMDYK
jgi:hypothetical protein